MTDVSSLLAVARAAARAGADQLAARPAGPVDAATLGAETKTSDSDWVTDFDRASEEAIRQVLHAYRPQDEITGEEFGQTIVDEPSGYRWSIDPLDGTTNFLRGLPHYCVSVAVEHEGIWQAAAIIAPQLGISWYASRGQGAFRIAEHGTVGLDTHPAEPVRLNGPADNPGQLLGTGFGYDADRRRYQFAQLQDIVSTGGFADVRRLGSAALDLCMVAEGSLDAYAEYGLQEYDWAAGALIAAEAGVPVRRPAWQFSDKTPDWTVAGLDFAWDLELDPGHPSPRVRTRGVTQLDRAARFGKQLSSHLGRKRGGGWDTDTGWMQLRDTMVTVQATDGELVFSTVGPGEEAELVHDVIDRHLVRFVKDDNLTTEWNTLAGA